MKGSKRSAGSRAAAVAVVAGVATTGVVGAGLASFDEPGRALMARARGARFLGVGGGVLQRATNDCGPAALAHCLRLRGRHAPYPDPDSALRLGPRGCSLGELAEEAARRGWSVVVRRLEVGELAAVPPPAILHLRPGHFVVYEGPGADGRFEGHDPAIGRVSWSRRALASRWGGEILHGAEPADGVGRPRTK